MNKGKKINEGLLDFFRSIRGGIRSGLAGYGSAKGALYLDRAKELLKKEIESSWNNFAISLKKAGYSAHQIADMKDAFDENIEKLITNAMKHYAS